ncbi:hypothetical protein RI129_000254 [Pyrocoelia pectoralis]|uniref:DNA helicase MCM9 n=1 Tax=Pyrocoelia pectoralis TaxID=417401 RepID=A0AAN7VI07_9COLE
MEEYLLSNYKQIFLHILENENVKKHFSLNINFIELFDNDTTLGNELLRDPEQSLDELNNWVLHVQDIILQQLVDNPNLSFKENVCARVYGLPACPELHRSTFPRAEDLNLFLQITGTVIKTRDPKMLEYRRSYKCTKCKYIETVTASYDQRFVILPPKRCTNPDPCGGRNLISVGGLIAENCKDYQEIKIQEKASNVNSTMPSSMWVTLEDDLVDTCQPGDDVTICGIVKRRWGALIVGKRIEVELCLKANHIQVHNGHTVSTLITTDIRNQFNSFWEVHRNSPLVGRDLILKSFCPKVALRYVFGKLALAVVLAGGSSAKNGNEIGPQKRSEAHLLLVGDPGTGKSQLIRYASKIIARSVLTTGVGTTSAGLTVAAIMEEGQWQLEAGALVLADGGICCIDEFNSMKTNDRASIHEAMEQQTISVAKAGILCKLRTRCSILAATNPKGGHLDVSQSLSLNLAIPSPLLSRFDVVLMLKDTYKYEWDSLIAKHILSESEKSKDSSALDSSLWSIEMLQQYFVLIKTLNPALTPISDQILAAYYQAQRREATRNKSRTTVRLLESLIRLSQGHARLMYHSEVHVIDAIFAIVLIECSMHGECAILSLGSLNVLESYQNDPMSYYAELATAVLTRLELNEILEHEINFLNKNYNTSYSNQNITIQRGTNVDSHSIREDVSPKLPTENNLHEDDNNFEIENNTGSNQKGTKRKKSTTKKQKTPKPADSNILHCIPSVNDSFNFNIYDSGGELGDDPCIPIESQNTKVKNILKEFKYKPKDVPSLPKYPKIPCDDIEENCATTSSQKVNDQFSNSSKVLETTIESVCSEISTKKKFIFKSSKTSPSSSNGGCSGTNQINNTMNSNKTNSVNEPATNKLSIFKFVPRKVPPTDNEKTTIFSNSIFEDADDKLDLDLDI